MDKNLNNTNELCDTIFESIVKFAKETNNTKTLFEYGSQILQDYTVSYPLNISINECLDNYTIGSKDYIKETFDYTKDVIKIKFGIKAYNISVVYCRILENDNTRELCNFLKMIHERTILKFVPNGTTDEVKRFIESSLINKGIHLLPNVECCNTNSEFPCSFYLNYKNLENDFVFDANYDLEAGQIYNMRLAFSLLEYPKYSTFESTIYKKIKYENLNSKSSSNFYKRTKSVDIFSSHNFNSSEKLGLKMMVNRGNVLNLPIKLYKNIVFNYEFTVIVPV